jgi:hypothetical protein
MHLLTPLAAGLVGCENGTFSIVRRGTSTPASYYTDFEGLTAPIVGTNIPLDSRGGGVFYVNELCKVTCKSALGVTIREFIAGDEATCLDVRSDSFTGTHYQTGAVAAGNPISLKALLDKWDNSAGADDWQVLVNGVATNLSTAFAALQGQRRFVVTSYGAVGDGVTNDTSAINAAISAANAAGGGVVSFPPGNYLCSTVTAFSTVSLEGAGPTLTTITLLTGGTIFINGAMAAVVRGFKFTFSGATSSGYYILASTIVSGQGYLVEDCTFAKKGTGGGGGAIAFVSATAHSAVISRCDVEISGDGQGINNGSGCDMRVLNSKVRCTDAVGNAAQAFRTVGAGLFVVACILDFSAVTSGTAQAFSELGGTGTTLAVANSIVPPGTAVNWRVFNNAIGRRIVESGNTTGLTTANYGTSYGVYSSSASGSQFGSRQGAFVYFTSNADPLLLPLGEAAVVRVRITDGSGWSANCSLGDAYSSAPGLTCVVMIWNDTAGSLNFDAFWQTTGTFAVAANSVRVFQLVSMLNAGGNLTWYPVSDTAGALDAE